MKRKDRTRGSRFEITEKTLPLCARDGSDLQDPLSALQQDIGGLMKKLADARQALSESERLHQEQVELILHSILEVIDAFDRIFSSVDKKKEQITGQMKVWLGNFRTVSRLVRRILDAEGVVPIENLDEGFDPRWHKVAETVADPLKVDGSIVEVVRKGYVWKGHVLRKAEVIVVRNADEACSPNRKPPTFFMPGTADTEEAERLYEDIRNQAMARIGTRTHDNRVFSLKLKAGGVIAVGESAGSAAGVVLTILDFHRPQQYGIVAMPPQASDFSLSLIGYSAVAETTYFDGWDQRNTFQDLLEND